MQQRDREHRRDQHQNRNYRTAVKIRYAAQHLIVKHCRHHLILPSHGGRNPIVRKAQEETLYKGGRQRPQQRPGHRPEKRLPRIIPHNPGYNGEFLVYVFHGVGHQQK